MMFRFENKTDPREVSVRSSREVANGAELLPVELEDTFPSAEGVGRLEMANATTVPRRRKLKRIGGGGGGDRDPKEDGTRTVLYGFRYALEGMLVFLASLALSGAAAMAGATLFPAALFFAGLGAMVGRLLLAGWIQPSLMKQVFFAAGGLVAALTLYILGLGVIAGFPALGGVAVVSGVAYLGVALVGAVWGFFSHKYKG